VAVDVNIKGKYARGIETSSNNTSNPAIEIPDLPFPENERRTLNGPNSEGISSCNLEDQLSNVNPGMAIAQETVFWCWAASPQMVIKFHDPDKDLEQCQIVTDIKHNGRSRDGAPFCCPEPTDIDCLQNGRPEDVFNKKGYTFEPWIYSLRPPLRATQIRGQLCTNGIFPHIVLVDDNGGHVVIVTDILKVGDRIDVVVFDPLMEEFRPVDYEIFKEGYIGSGSVKYNIDRDLVLIGKPQ
jgi:hypothetical protein